MLNVVFDREVFCHLTSFQSILMISLKNFDSLVMVYTLVYGVYGLHPLCR